MANPINFNEQQLGASLKSLNLHFDENDWFSTEKLLDELAIKRKEGAKERARKFLLLGVALMISVGFFSFIILKDKFLPQGKETKSFLSATIEEETVRAEKIFSDVGQLETPDKAAVLKVATQTDTARNDSVKNVERIVMMTKTHKTNLVPTKQKNSKKRKKESSKKNKKKSSSDSIEPSTSNSKAEENIIQ